MAETHVIDAEEALRERLTAEKVRIHYSQLPGMILAPTLGGLFSSWVLWNAVDNRWLIIGMSIVFLLSAARAVLYFQFRKTPEEHRDDRRWRHFAFAGALLSGMVWGSAAIVLYPPLQSDYLVYLVAMLSLTPVAPVAALAVYLPTFYAYYIPCITPFVVILLLSGNRPEQLTGLLLIIASGATINFALEYARTLNESLRLRLQLGDKTLALEHAARVKTHFLAAASHDLRQPVHAMGLFLESLRPRLRKPEDRELLDNVDSALQGLRGMLSEMLDISRLDAEVVHVDRRPLRLCDLLEKLAQEYAPQAAGKGLRLRFRCPDHGITVISDGSMLERILRNLLENALKYTQRGGILLACRQRGDHVLVQVIDTGRGIAAENLDEIFLEFTQIDNPARDATRGLGLGLAIVQRLARLLGHEITVRSQPGQGSTFNLWLAGGEESARVAPAASTPASPTDRSLAGLGPVLIIDDDEGIRSGTARLLRQWGGHPLSADSAEAALALLRETGERPNVLVVDYRLAEGQTALAAIDRLQAFLRTTVPAIIITGDTDPERIREAHGSGHLLLHKPLEPERLKLCLASLATSPAETTP